MSLTTEHLEEIRRRVDLNLGFMSFNPDVNQCIRDREALLEEVDRLKLITPQMIQVATEILWDSGIVECEAEGTDQLVVEDMIRAAFAAKEKR